MRSILVTGILASAAFSGLAQSQVTAPSKSGQNKSPSVTKTPAYGELVGHAFIITKGGDLKPARLARVWIMYRSTKKQAEEDARPSTAGEKMVGNLTDASLQSAKLRAEVLAKTTEVNQTIEGVLCAREMVFFAMAILSTTKWAKDNDKIGQVLVADADEDGQFRIARVPVGLYTVLVSGRAGMYDALWEERDVEIHPGKATSIKMSDPQKACN
jgi:hypothetical protein